MASSSTRGGHRHRFRGGIGQAYAEALAREGAAVVVADINAEGGERVAKQIVADGERRSACRSTCPTRVGQGHGRSHAGRVRRNRLPGQQRRDLRRHEADLLLTVDWDYYKKFMSVNLDGALVCTRAVYRKMAKRGGGAIVNQSSTAAWMYANFYGLAKVGVNGLTQQLSRAWRDEHPHQRDRARADRHRGQQHHDTAGDGRRYREGYSVVTHGQPDDLVGMCLFLLSDQARWITGQIFNVDGGQIIRSWRRQ